MDESFKKLSSCKEKKRKFEKTNLMFINANIPSFKCKLRKEFLHGFLDYQNQYENCTVFSVSSHCGQALLFNVLIDGGAAWECLPLHAFCWDEHAPKWMLEYHQPYDCFSNDIGVVEFDYLKNIPVLVRIGQEFYDGIYMFTVDWANYPDEETYKKKNMLHVIKLNNGLFVAQPNNRILWNHPDTYLDKSKREYKPLSESWSCQHVV